MAHGVKVWLAVVVVASLAAFGLIRTWSESVARALPGVPRDSLQLVHDSLICDASHAATAIQRIRWSRAIGDADTLLVLGPHLPVQESFGRRVAQARARLDRDPRVDVAVAVTTRRWQRPDDGSRYRSYIESHGTDYLLPDGGPCQVMMFVPGGPTTPSVLDTYFATDYLLGPCSFVARYGPPSDAVRAWIQWGGGRFARSLEPSTPLADRGPAIDTGDTTEKARQNRLNRLERACRLGNAGACSLAVFPTGVSRRPHRSFDDADAPEELVLFGHDIFPGNPFGSLGAHLLADIEAEIGPDRFAAFWRTDRPVNAALADALGRPPGEWVADWAAARVPEPDRAGLRWTDVLFSLLAVAVFAAIGLLVGARGRPNTGL